MLSIRRNIFEVSQAEMATIAGTSQATVSRWEAGQLYPSLPQMEAIRSEASRRGLPWDDGWFFSGAPQRAHSTDEAAA